MQTLQSLWLCRFPLTNLESMGGEWGRSEGNEVEISTADSWVSLSSAESPLQAVLYLLQGSREIVYVILQAKRQQPYANRSKDVTIRR